MTTDAAAAHHDEHHGPDYLAHHFETPLQQFESAKLGIWLFLAQEILFFSGLFVAYGIFRSWYPEAFSIGSHILSWQMGTANTFVLLISSFTAAQAVAEAQKGNTKNVSTLLIITLACAGIFMVVKYLEYSHKFHVGTLPANYFAPTPQGQADIVVAAEAAHLGSGGISQHLGTFFGVYFAITGVHGLHVLIGMGVITWILIRNMRGEFSEDFWTPVDLVALYWHLVDLIWIYVFPLVYLID